MPQIGANFKQSFERYVDVSSIALFANKVLIHQSIIDLLIPGQSPGIKGPIVDVSGRTDPEILFFGPDENSADLMDWAAEHARARNAPWWKSFTTGKSAAKLGGIPHDICKLDSTLSTGARS